MQIFMSHPVYKDEKKRIKIKDKDDCTLNPFPSPIIIISELSVHHPRKDWQQQHFFLLSSCFFLSLFLSLCPYSIHTYIPTYCLSIYPSLSLSVSLPSSLTIFLIFTSIFLDILWKKNCLCSN